MLRLTVAALALAACLPWVGACAADGPKVVIIRHGEKPEFGDNLSCQGENRALQLPAVLHQKFGKPDYTYVPALKLGKSTNHARMFQTVVPFAVKYDLTLNSKFAESDVAGAAKDVLAHTGLVLMVWEHSQIPSLVAALGVSQSPTWKKEDFDSIWIVSYAAGQAVMAIEAEGITPSTQCAF
jgi:hypothetical protein